MFGIAGNVTVGRMDHGRSTHDDASPFHEGEVAVQRRAGAKDKIESIGRALIRDHMPDQHREFFAKLPFFVLGALDAAGRPWASAVDGEPGFVSSPDPTHLRISAEPRIEDPIREGMRPGAFVGGLGIELHTRRRNRVNGKVEIDPTARGFTLAVDQSFGNCPQYIQARELARVEVTPSPAVRGDRLDDEARKTIRCADTFFIASHHGDDRGRRAHGVDVSHRGGFRGFVRALDDRRLEFPDYRGNFLFNTLGNLAANPRCGLLFLSFVHGDVVQLTGTAEILWDFPRDCALEGAERVIRFHTEAMVRTPGAFPLRGDLRDYAPQLLALCHQPKG